MAACKKPHVIGQLKSQHTSWWIYPLQ